MATVRKRKPTLTSGVPAELADRDAAVWHDHAEYVAYMDAHGYALSIRDRFGAGWPESRRRAAVEGWAHDEGIVRDDVPAFLDYHRLDALEVL